jgi:hypothetical protein
MEPTSVAMLRSKTSIELRNLFGCWRQAQHAVRERDLDVRWRHVDRVGLELDAVSDRDDVHPGTAREDLREQALLPR